MGTGAPPGSVTGANGLTTDANIVRVARTRRRESDFTEVCLTLASRLDAVNTEIC
jgi:hypothetical protein